MPKSDNVVTELLEREKANIDRRMVRLSARRAEIEKQLARLAEPAAPPERKPLETEATAMRAAAEHPRPITTDETLPAALDVANQIKEGVR